MPASQILSRPRDAAESPPGPVRRVAVIDLGSNTARLVVYEAPEGGMPRVILERKEVPRLGEGVGKGGRLGPAAVERGRQSIRRFARTLETIGSPPTIAVATSAVRDAADGPTFLKSIGEETGIEFRILTGEEEARYSYLGVASAWALGNDIVCDLGGGSLQLGFVRKGAFRSGVSLPLGALRLTEEFLEHDPPKEREIEDLRQHVRDFFADALPPSAESGDLALHGVGGTIRTLARIAIVVHQYPISRVHGFPLRRRDLVAISELFEGLPAEKRRDIPGIGGERADVIVAGLYTVLELLDATHLGELLVSGMGIREGIAQERLGLPLPAPTETLLERSALTAARAFGYSIGREQALARRALSLFSIFDGPEGWEAPERRALLAAALFHDAGAAVDLWGHARHTAYLLRNYPLVGLDHRELLLAALVAYQHEGDETPPTLVKELRPLVEKEDLRTARRLGVLLSAAEDLDDEGAKFQRSGTGPLVVSLSEEGGSTLSPRAISRVRKALKRTFDLEVEVRGARE